MYQEIAANKRKTWLMIILFIGLISGLTYLAASLYDWGLSPVILAVFISLIMSLTSFYAGDSLALSMAGAKKIEPTDNPYVYRLVETLAITAGTPVPKVYIIPDTGLNAFATGRDPQHASIAMTTGIIESLNNEELEGVIAHELSHIKNYDIRLMMVTIICVSIITLLADWIVRMGGLGRQRSREGSANTILLIVGLVIALLTPLFAQLLKLAVSRKREFLADASGALLTRYPEGLASALEKISRSQPLR